MLSHLSVTRTLARGKLILSVDATRLPEDPFKLPSPLAAQLREELRALKRAAATCVAHHRDDATQAPLRSAFGKLEAALRRGHAGTCAIIGRSLLPSGISDTDRLAIFTAYGWGSGTTGALSHSKLLLLGELALRSEAIVANPDWRYPKKLIQVIREQLETIAREKAAQICPDIAPPFERVENRLGEVQRFYLEAGDSPGRSCELSRISLLQVP